MKREVICMSDFSKKYRVSLAREAGILEGNLVFHHNHYLWLLEINFTFYVVSPKLINRFS